ETILVEPVGTAAKAAATCSVTLPDAPGLHRIPLQTPAGVTNPVTFFVSPLPQTVSGRTAGLDPRTPTGADRPSSAGSPANAQTLAIPCGVSGRMDRPRDVNYFRFRGEKGKSVRFEVR